MYQVSQALSDFIMGDARHFTAIMSFANGTILSEEICSLDLLKATSTDDILPGDVISASLSGTLTGLESTIQGQTFILTLLGVSYNNHSTYGYLHEYTYGVLHSYTYGAMPGSLPQEPIPLGEFTVTDCRKQNDLWTFEAHDKLYASDSTYTSGLTYPASLSDVEHEICNALGITFRDSIEQITIPYALEDVTYREMLGYIAGLLGKVCTVGRTGKLEYRTFTETGYTIQPDRAADPDISQESVKITSIHCGEFSATATGAQDRDITFDDPYMTAALFENTEDNFLALLYTPLTIAHTMGDPRFDILDLVTIKRAEDNATFKVPLMSMSYQWDGGVWSSLAATASTKTTYTANRTNVRPIQQQIKAASQETIDYISGAKGGYVITKYNEDGQPIAHYYTDNLDPEQATNIMQINQNGLRGTNGGMNGVWKTAITNDGRINAAQIQIGELKSTNYTKDPTTGAETGSIFKMDDGTFSFGGGKLKFENGKLTVESAEIIGGSFVVQTADESDAVINFSSGDWEIEISPLEWVLTNSEDHTMIVAQAGGIFFYDTTNSDKLRALLEQDSLTFYDNTGTNMVATINRTGQVFANDVFIKLSDSPSAEYKSLRDYINNHP